MLDLAFYLWPAFLAGIVKLREGLDGRADCHRAKELAGRRGDKEAALAAEECLHGHLTSAGSQHKHSER